MEKNLYIDANVFIFAYIDEGIIGIKCRKIIERIIENKIMAFTSVLSFDEVFYKVKKVKDKETALLATKAFLNMKNLEFIDVDMNVIWKSQELIGSYNLNPREAIHIACALTKGLRNILTNDKDFNKVKEIRMIDIEEHSKNR